MKNNVGEGIRWVGGRVDGCELRIEAFVKMQKVGWGLVGSVGGREDVYQELRCENAKQVRGVGKVDMNQEFELL